MGQPFVGEIRMFAGNFAPAGWHFCDGSLQPISENETLFNLIGTTYGGDGQSTFALPDLQGRVPMHQGTGNGLTARIIGEMSGTETVTLTVNQIPSHQHAPQASASGGTQASPTNGVWAASTLGQYSSGTPAAAMDPTSLGGSGGNQPHENMIPFLTVSNIISLFGIYPTPN
jgi:microcystin-dependent protein